MRHLENGLPAAPAMRRALGVLALALASLLADTVPAAPPAQVSAALGPAGAAALQSQSHLPLYFVENRGQAAPDITFSTRAGAVEFQFTDRGVSARLNAGGRGDGAPAQLRADFVDASTHAPARSLKSAPAVINMLHGSNPDSWFTGIPTHARIGYAGVWPGVDVIFDGASGALESTYVVSPGATTSAIRIRYAGAEGLALAADGSLKIRTGEGVLSEAAPRIYQQFGDRRAPIGGRFDLIDQETVAFVVGQYDDTAPLFIDPVVTYSTFLGGAGSDQGNDVAIDGSGNAYVTGFTTSTNFPTAVSSQPANAGIRDAFVTKLNAAGSALVYSTYIGGADFDEAKAIALDASGNAYITGTTFSTDFPTMTPLQALNAGGQDVFITKLNASGGLAYSTYFGGTSDDTGRAITASGTTVTLTGTTISTDLPLVTPVQLGLNGISDAFVARLSSAGNTLLYSTYLGGAGTEDGRGVASDGSGNAYVTGSTSSSTQFPTMAPLQAALGGVEDAFVTKLTGAGVLSYSTYLGGSATDGGYGIAIDSAGAAYVAGLTSSPNFPTALPQQPASGGGEDAFLTKLNAAGSALIYSTYLGGSGADAASSIAVNASGSAFVTGSTFSANFPTASAFQATHTGAAADSFVTEINAGGNALTYSSYLGGSATDRGWGIAADDAATAYVTGSTLSSDFPPHAPFQAAYGGAADAFVAKISPAAPPPPSVGGIAEPPDLALVRDGAADRASGSNGVDPWFIADVILLTVAVASYIVRRTRRA